MVQVYEYSNFFAVCACASDSALARELRGPARSSPVCTVNMAVVKFYGLKRPVSSDEGDGESSITVRALVTVIPVQLDI